MPIEPSAEVAALIQAFSAAWRSGDAAGVEATLSSSDSVIMAGPAAQPFIGREAVLAAIRGIVPMNKGPNAGAVHFHQSECFRDGGMGWGHARGVLTLASGRQHHWNAALTVRLEEAGWKWVLLCAYAPIPFELIGTEALGFL